MVFELGNAAVNLAMDAPGGSRPGFSVSPLPGIFHALYNKCPEVRQFMPGSNAGSSGNGVPEWDMLSFGPTLEGVHSPDEKIYIDTVEVLAIPAGNSENAT
jgi:dipeptidase D